MSVAKILSVHKRQAKGFHVSFSFFLTVKKSVPFHKLPDQQVCSIFFYLGVVAVWTEADRPKDSNEIISIIHHIPTNNLEFSSEIKTDRITLQK